MYSACSSNSSCIVAVVVLVYIYICVCMDTHIYTLLLLLLLYTHTCYLYIYLYIYNKLIFKLSNSIKIRFKLKTTLKRTQGALLALFSRYMQIAH